MTPQTQRARKALRRTYLAVIPLLVLLAACAENAPLDTLEPKGPVARQIDNLIDPVFWVAGVVFVLVQGLAIYAVIKFRHRDDAPEPVQIHGNTRLELAWTLAPALVLLIIAVPTIRAIFDLNDAPDDSIRVTVIGHQFWWEYRYEDYGIVTANDLYMPTGRSVAITLDGDELDVIHSFWVPALGGKQDIIPGRTNKMHFEADEPGIYLGQCTEYCGLSHANMRNRAIAVPPAEFDAWVANQKLPAREPAQGTEAHEGFLLFTAKGCAGCHTIEGLSTGNVAPNLTHFASRGTFAGSLFDNTPGNLRRWLKDPPGEKPGSKMPNLGLTDDEIAKLIAYMETLQ
ncbi:MAG: cytochrome c oxidase subunit II [Acidimicrobiales bacterium]